MVKIVISKVINPSHAHSIQLRRGEHIGQGVVEEEEEEEEIILFLQTKLQ